MNNGLGWFRLPGLFRWFGKMFRRRHGRGLRMIWFVWPYDMCLVLLWFRMILGGLPPDREGLDSGCGEMAFRDHRCFMLITQCVRRLDINLTAGCPRNGIGGRALVDHGLIDHGNFGDINSLLDDGDVVDDDCLRALWFHHPAFFDKDK